MRAAQRIEIVEPHWLTEHIGRDDVIVVEVFASTTADDAAAARAAYRAGHIPSSHLVDLQADFSHPASPFRFMRPSSISFVAAAGRIGIDDDTRIVIYSRTRLSSATRFAWPFLHFGQRQVFVLNANIEVWVAEGYPLEARSPKLRLGGGPSVRQGARFVDFEEVQAALDNPDIRLVNALALREGHGGSDGDQIPGSVNLPFSNLLTGDGRLRPLDQLAPVILAMIGAPRSRAIICYCGGGVAATGLALILHMFDYEVSVYDGSLQEWRTRLQTGVSHDQS